MRQMRMLWEQHSCWTRAAIVSLVFDLPNVDAVVGRLLRNPVDFENTLRFFYGDSIASRFKDLLTEHLTLSADLVKALKAGNTQEAQELERKWYENGEKIAVFLGRINPYWSAEQWRMLMRHHLDLVKAEAGAILEGNHEASIGIYDEIEQQAMVMADVMASGIINQFGVR